MSEEDETAPTERLPAPLRLRSAGFGVILAGLVLAPISFLFAYPLAAGLLVATAIGVGIDSRGNRTLVQLWVGFGAVGVIGLVEALSAVGLGLGPLALAGLAVVFGAVDVVTGTVVDGVRVRS